MDRNDLANRFNHHPPINDDVASLFGVIRRECLALANVINDLAPEGRDKSLAITKLEETMYWANAAIARNQDAAGKGLDTKVEI